MPRKLTANRSSAREARGLVGQMICPTSRSPWPARGPLGRLREARQGSGEARTVATIGIVRHAHYSLTRVKVAGRSLVKNDTALFSSPVRSVRSDCRRRSQQGPYTAGQISPSE